LSKDFQILQKIYEFKNEKYKIKDIFTSRNKSIGGIGSSNL
jgi:hypothetical protein